MMTFLHKKSRCPVRGSGWKDYAARKLQQAQ
jgi:hypothetical protein